MGEAAMLDLTAKPSLATYGFRPDTPVHKPPASQARDSDEALIANVEQQAELGVRLVRSGHEKKGMKVLRRAFELAERHRGVAGAVSPAACLAKGMLHVTRGMLLSRLDAHAEAVDEAREACRVTDNLWQIMAGASAEAEVSWLGGDYSRPARDLKRLLSCPPKWLERAVEVSIQARQCLALELEYMCKPPRPPPEPEGDELGGETTPGRDRARDALEWVLLGGAEQKEKAQDALERVLLFAQLEAEAKEEEAENMIIQEIERLHEEAVVLAGQLLPDAHSVRARAEKAQDERQTRMTTFATPSPPSVLVTKAPLPPLKPRSPGQAMVGTLLESNLSVEKPSKRSSLSPVPLGSSADFSFDMSEQDLSPGSRFSPTSSTTPSAMRGDVFISSLPMPSTESHRGSRRSRRKHSSSVRSAGAPSSPQTPPADPFKDWMRSAVTDVARMSLGQFKLQTEQGMGQLREDLARQNRLFKFVEMKDYDNDRLYENRMFYSNHGVKSLRKGLQRKSSRQAQAPKDAERSAKAGSELYSHSGVKSMSGGGSLPDLKSLNRLMKESFANNPIEKERRTREEQERRAAEAAERERQRKETEDILKGNLTAFRRPSKDAVAF
jgi:hypothetical protein